MKDEMRSRICFMAVLLFLAFTMMSCATAGRSFSEAEVKNIQIGQTSRQDIRSMFGPPWRIGLENGQETWTYGHYRYSIASSSKSSDLVVRFDKKGVDSSYSYSTTNPNAVP